MHYITLTQDQLSRTLMPCGAYSKTEIREIAEKIGLEVFRKKRFSRDMLCS